LAIDDEEEKGDGDGDDGEAEEEAMAEAADVEAEAGDDEEEIDQKKIDRVWIKDMDRNYPCWTYYKTLKKNLLIILNSERIATRKYPKWSEDLFSTFSKLTNCVPEINYLYQELGLNQENIMLSAGALQSGLNQW